MIDNVDPLVSTAYIDKPPFNVRIKEDAKASIMVNKSYVRTTKPYEKIKVEPSTAMVKYLLVDNIDGHVIYFSDEATRIVKRDTKNKNRPVVGMHAISVKWEIIVIMVYVIWVLVLVLFLLPYIKKLCMR